MEVTLDSGTMIAVENVFDGFGEETNLMLLQGAGSLAGRPYLALSSRKT
jgi:hypothetical protein